MKNKIKRRTRKIAKPRRMVYKTQSQNLHPNPKRNQLDLFPKVFLFIISYNVLFITEYNFIYLVFGFFGMLISYTLLLAMLSGLSLYALSYYDKKAYGNVKAKILPIWVSATSNLDPQVASKVNFYLQHAGTSFDLAVQTSIQASIKSYKWIKANPTVQQYVKNVQDTWKSLWDSVFKKVKSTT